MDKEKIRKIYRNYQNIADDFEVRQLTSGHLNQTFLIRNADSSCLLQHLNTTIFKNLDIITANDLQVAVHLEKKDYPHGILMPLAFKNGEYLLEGEWRIFPYFEESKTFLKVDSPEQAFEAAKFLSEFHYYLKDMDTAEIRPSIPGFLDFNARWESFKKALRESLKERRKKADKEIRFVQENQNILKEWNTVLSYFPDRLIHADPKISNFLFHKESQAKIKALIDWDTLMAGPILYDFGDMVRSYTNLKDEDDPDADGDHFSKENFEALKEGFLYALKEELTQKEIQNMDLAGKVVIYVQILRFLTDYLNNDIYYSTDYENHNLDRTVNQINLLKGLQQQI